MLYTNNLIPNAALVVSYTNITGTFYVAGVLDYPISYASFVNTTNQPVVVSLDGTNIAEVVPSGQSIPLPLGLLSIEKYGAFIQAGVTIRVKAEGTNPTSGNFSFTSWRLAR